MGGFDKSFKEKKFEEEHKKDNEAAPPGTLPLLALDGVSTRRDPINGDEVKITLRSDHRTAQTLGRLEGNMAADHPEYGMKVSIGEPSAELNGFTPVVVTARAESALAVARMLDGNAWIQNDLMVPSRLAEALQKQLGAGMAAGV